jgi:hypothetical protein
VPAAASFELRLEFWGSFLLSGFGVVLVGVIGGWIACDIDCVGAMEVGCP